jgi:tetratricopeptide (TPR) repeat protein
MISRANVLVLGCTILMAVLMVGCGSRWLAGGKLHFDQERYPQALENFEKAASEQPNNPETHMWVGSTLARLERDEEAVEAIERAEAVSTAEVEESIANVRVSYWSVRYNSGLAYAKDGADARAAGDEAEATKQLELAVDRFERAILFCPDSVQNFSNLGKVLFQLGRRDEGMTNFQKARGMAGDNPQLLEFLFRVYRSLGIQAVERRTAAGYREAIEMFERAISFDRPVEDMVPIYFNMGVAHAELGRLLEGGTKAQQLNAAVECYQKVLETEPEDTATLENLAFVYSELGEHEHAVEYGQRLLDTEPWSHVYHFVLVRLYNTAGDREKSAAHLMLQTSLSSGDTVAPSQSRQLASAAGPGSDMLRTLRSRGEPEEMFRYMGSRGEYYIWFYWTEGRVFIFKDGEQVFRAEFRALSREERDSLKESR